MRVYVKKIEKKILQDLNDEIASIITVGKVNSVDGLRIYLKEELQKWWNEYSEIRFYDSIVSELLFKIIPQPFNSVNLATCNF